jgi:PAS domain S-box-containing protein
LVSRFQPDGTFLYANNGFCTFFGVTKEAVEGSKWHPIAHPDDLPMIKEKLSQLSPENPAVFIENRVYDARGKIQWVQFSNKAFFNEHGLILEIQSVGRDITDQKQAEAALLESQKILSHAQSLAGIGGSVYDVEQDQLYQSEEWCRIHGVKAKRLTMDQLLPLAHQEDLPRIQTAFEKTLNYGDPYIIEHRIIRPDTGEIRYVSAHGEAIKNSDGKVIKLFCAVQDITERKQVESRQNLTIEILKNINSPLSFTDIISRILLAIKKEMDLDAVGFRLRSGDDYPYYSQEGFSLEFVKAENNLTIPDRNGDVCRDGQGNPSLECTCGLVISGNKDPNNPLFTPYGSVWTNNSLSLLDLSPAEDPRLHPRNRCSHEGFLSVALIPIYVDREIVGLLQLNDRNQDRFTIEIMQYLEGVSASIGIMLKRRQAEEQIITSLKEKEVLLKEIHHRVKNNLTIIGSILSLQTPYLEDRKSREIFKECENRVRTMSKIHSKLYQSRDFAHIAFGSYLQELSQELFLSYQIDPDAIEFKTQIDNISLDINTALPLGLLLTELITNALKYAFPEGRKGKLQVSIQQENNQKVLTVADDGIGFPEHLDFQNTKTLGLQLVMGLVRQLDGTIEMKRKQGTVWTITFPAAKQAERGLKSS